jgi:hypothetical protein
MISKRVSFAAVAAFYAISSWVSAGTIVDFKPVPISPTTPEFTFSRALGGGVPAFRSAFGAISNNDGTLPLVSQTPGGLLVETPFIIPGVPGSQLTAASTLFFDSTLQFTAGLQANGPAINSGVFVQPLSPGSFVLTSTGPAPTLLLTGNITAATFIAGTGSAGAVFASQDVTYTGGLIFNAMVANGVPVAGNSMSISMTDVVPAFSINPNDGFLNDFNANATGLFSAVPEPTSLALIAMALGCLLLRRR